MNCKDYLDKLADHNERVPNPVKQATLGVRTKTLRRKLKLKAKDPLEYRGIAIKCIGSQKWRNESAGQSA